MSNSRRDQMAGSSSRRSETADQEEFLDLLAALSTSRGSVRSQSGRHTWQPGLIPPCLEPPHRIQSRFCVPKNTLNKVPELNHPELSRGQRSYLHSIAQIYSLDDTKRSLSNSYYGLLMSELLKGGGREDSHKRYSGWIYGNHKRLFETNPKIWRSRKLKSSRDDSTAQPASSDRASAAARKSESRTDRSKEKSPKSSTKNRTAQPADAAKPSSPSSESKEPKPTSESQQEQPSRRLQSARSRPSRNGSGKSTRTRADNDLEEPTVRVSGTGTAGESRARSAGRGSRTTSAASRPNNRADKNRSVYADSDDDDEVDRGRRPRDLSSIMY
ncbi:hypothetical protein BOX15_Mlig004989g2 [Macrostomum lignano]|uniref:Uncharacterized protein n=1 Tax=Macrostomum lignano TaxID=282301 RepID=A0A267F732_9PLAT|nr:hypothetical protein BOX15_Mlig004989g2 [Macrostomum lignano]